MAFLLHLEVFFIEAIDELICFDYYFLKVSRAVCEYDRFSVSSISDPSLLILSLFFSAHKLLALLYLIIQVSLIFSCALRFGLQSLGNSFFGEQ